MSKAKTTISGPKELPVAPAVRGYGVVAGAKAPPPEVVSFELDENDDLGGDPYNRTGSHCVLKITEDA